MPKIDGQTFTAGFTVEVLAAEKAGDRGKVKALVSAYNKPYQMGYAEDHVILNGAFADSLSDNPNVPLFWQHNWAGTERPPIGVATGTETKDGLVVEGEFFLDTEDGRSVFNAMKAGAIREWSIGYRITEYTEEASDNGRTTVKASKGELMEASAVLRGANPDTQTLQVAAQKAFEDQIAKIVDEKVAELSSRVSGLAIAVSGIDDDVEALYEAAAADDETPFEQALAAGADPICVDCGEQATQVRALTEDIDELVCDDHVANVEVKIGDLQGVLAKIGELMSEDASGSDAPQPSTASEGQEVTVEPATPVVGEEPGAVAATAPDPKVPDFLPRLTDEEREALNAQLEDDDFDAFIRVSRCWNKR